VAEPSSPRRGHPAEGTTVTVIADGETEAFETTPEEERELLEAIAGVDTGETVAPAELLERLRR